MVLVASSFSEGEKHEIGIFQNDLCGNSPFLALIGPVEGDVPRVAFLPSVVLYAFLLETRVSDLSF